jgi:hypothetical protein
MQSFCKNLNYENINVQIESFIILAYKRKEEKKQLLFILSHYERTLSKVL